MRIRFKTRTLLILTALLTLPALYYGSVVKQQRAESKALVNLSNNGCSFSMRAKPIEYSENDFTNRVLKILNWPVGLVFGDDYLNHVYTIDLHISPKTTGNLEALTELKHLAHVTFDSQTDESILDRYVSTLVKIESLKSVSTYLNQINVESYERLTAAGISVDHYGIREYELNSNFLFTGDRFCPVDIERSGISVSLATSETGLSFSLDISTNDPMPRHLIPEPGFYTISVKTVGTFDEIVGSGRVFKSKGEFNDGSNYYDGIHQGLFNNAMELISFSNNQLHLKWHFDIDDSGPGPFVDVELPLEEVTVFLDPNSEEEKAPADQKQLATRLLSEYFDSNLFSEPVYVEPRNENRGRFKFILKD